MGSRASPSPARRGGRELLYDLASDPGEDVDLSSEHPAILEALRDRVGELMLALETSAPEGRELTSQERARLEALGYVDSNEEGIAEYGRSLPE